MPRQGRSKPPAHTKTMDTIKRYQSRGALVPTVFFDPRDVRGF